MIVASIPSPPSGGIELGPLDVRAYGVLIAVGVLVATAIANRRWTRRGGDPAAITAVVTWAVPFGIVGARAYHVITDWQLFRGDWLRALAIWEGGLGIWGAIAGGALGAWIACRRHDLDFRRLADAAAPAIPVAQAIGRLGNWFNQELFGRPTDLPWALEIDPAHRPPGFVEHATFHPTFLYELVWNLGVAGLVLLVERRLRLRPGRLFGVYVAGYTAGRLWIELLRIDPANEILGLRVNVWTSLVVLAAALVFVLTGRLRAEDREEPAEHATGEDEEPAGEPGPEAADGSEARTREPGTGRAEPG